MGFVSSRVDAEDHTLPTVTLLRTEHPDRIRVHDLEFHRRRWAHSVVGVWHKTRIDTTSHLHTRFFESGLSNGVVL
jgi:hypothetical protein